MSSEGSGVVSPLAPLLGFTAAPGAVTPEEQCGRPADVTEPIRRYPSKPGTPRMSSNHLVHSNAGDRIGNAERTLRHARVANCDPHVPPRSRTLNGGLDPAEMGRRSGEARRAKAAEREEHRRQDALTVRQ